MRRPWLLRMRWHDLLFAHWRLDPDVVRPLVPTPLELEIFDGSAWVGVVPFRMSHVAPRGVPRPLGLPSFPEVNVRTYATYQGRPGVSFLSLDATDRLAVATARRVVGLPYHRATMELVQEATGWFDVRSERSGGGATLRIRYRPLGVARPAPPGSLAAFLTDRVRLWTVDRQQRPRATEIRHAPWPLEEAEATIDDVAIAGAAGVALIGPPDDLAFSPGVDVVAWWPRRASP